MSTIPAKPSSSTSKSIHYSHFTNIIFLLHIVKCTFLIVTKLQPSLKNSRRQPLMLNQSMINYLFPSPHPLGSNSQKLQPPNGITPLRAGHMVTYVLKKKTMATLFVQHISSHVSAMCLTQKVKNIKPRVGNNALRQYILIFSLSF